MLVIFKAWRCATKWGQYGNGRLALSLVDEETGEPIAKASVNVGDEIPLGATQMDVKSWSENEGMVEALFEAGIGMPLEGDPLIPCGYATADRIELSAEALKEAREQGWAG